MTFRRTSLGLKNQPVFFDVDIVVYVEGANKSNLASGEYEEGEVITQDSLFWDGVLHAVLPGVKLHFKALGSKSALIELSSSLDEQVRGSLLICVDRDFDDIAPSNVSLNFMVKTYRYSWEADIWVWVVFLAMLEGFLPAGRAPTTVVANVRSNRDRFFSAIAKFAKLDAQTAFHSGAKCFMPRSNPAAVTAQSSSGYPELNKAYLQVRLKEYRAQLNRPWRPGLSNSFSPKRHLFGKVIDKFHCQLAVASMKALGLPGNIPSFIFQNAAIRLLPNALVSGSRNAQLDYYRQSVTVAM